MIRLKHGLKALACIATATLVAGCGELYSANVDTAIGEQRTVPYSAHDAFINTKDALMEQALLANATPDNNELTTQWRDAESVGFWGSLVNKHPRYRYEIQVVPESPNRSTIVVNVRTEDIPDSDLDKYKASTRLDLFDKIDQIAAKNPPTTGTPKEGGVNYSLLPGEDLRALSKRVTGSPANWQTIAQDNGLKSPTDTAGVKSVWVRNTLLKPTSSALQLDQ
ncbi:MAG TPA: hypothetical protein VMA09_04120 [Candidatus Binataceae bacterium]|nr:hypothetical protein [Candidatus Binataceae bacterium]